MSKLFMKGLVLLESGIEDGLKLCCQKERMEPWQSPFGNRNSLSLSIMCCWWRVICDCCVGKRKGRTGMKAKVSFILVLQVLFYLIFLQN